jgi:hypothetical protein
MILPLLTWNFVIMVIVLYRPPVLAWAFKSVEELLYLVRHTPSRAMGRDGHCSPRGISQYCLRPHVVWRVLRSPEGVPQGTHVGDISGGRGRGAWLGMGLGCRGRR